MNFSKITLSLLLLLSVVNHLAAEELPAYKDKSVVGVDRLASRATFWYYTSREDALQSSYLYHPDNISLNGEWSFNFCEKPADRVVDFYRNDFDASAWDMIDVPGSWPMQGYDKPLYMNHPYEFNTKAPFPAQVPDKWNPVGAYRRHFEVPASWKGERIILHFGAIKSAFYVWVNGKKVGYSQDSKMQAEFDITKFVKCGEVNNISVEVYRFSIGSYLEGQDMWRLAGIKRDVWIYSTPKSYVADIEALTSLENNYQDGVVDLTLTIGGDKSANATTLIELLSPTGEVVFDQTIKTPKSGEYRLQAKVDNCQTWSDEHPNLYTLMVTHNSSKIKRYNAVKVGLRSIELTNSQLLVNGRAIRIKGVNRHEHHPTYGHYVPSETTFKDIELMKQLNINAIRTSHYPADPYLYELCNQYGLYICSEANVETHGLGAALQAYYDPEKHIADDPSWEPLFHDRIFRMVERDKNHPSIIMWSIGNECGDGSIFKNGYSKLKLRDPSRLVIFEQAGMQSHTDIVGPMYMTMDKMRNYSMANDTYRPIILCEYAHAMGNSLGNFDDYWQMIDSHRNMQGGFVWDWVDQGVEDFRDGVRFFDYGGAFGLEEMVNSGAFCLNGVVNPDRVPNPHAYELRKVYDNIDIRLREGRYNEFYIRNKNAFTPLSAFDVSWILTKDGKVIESGVILDEVNAGDEELCRLAFNEEITNHHDYLVTFSVKQPQSVGLLPANYEVAAEQIQLSNKRVVDYTPLASSAVVLNHTEDQIELRGEDFCYSINRSTGRISSIKVAEEEFLVSDSEYDFHRVPVDNDGWDKGAKYWRDAHKRTSLIEITATQKSVGEVVIVAKSYVDADQKSRRNAHFTTTYTIYGDGTIEVDNSFIPISYHAEQAVALPRLGERYIIRGDLSHTSWYGRGPWENYADRKSSAFVGEYQMPTEELSSQYIRPQACGYRTDTRTLSLSNNKGVELNVIGKTPFCFEATHYPKENYIKDDKKIRNTVDLKRDDNLYLNIDYAQKGVGGDNSWGNPVHIEYQILLRPYNYGYYIIPWVK